MSENALPNLLGFGSRRGPQNWVTFGGAAFAPPTPPNLEELIKSVDQLEESTRHTVMIRPVTPAQRHRHRYLAEELPAPQPDYVDGWLISWIHQMPFDPKPQNWLEQLGHGDVLAKFIRLGLSVCGPVGAIIGEFLTEFVPGQRVDRLHEFTETLAERIAGVELQRDLLREQVAIAEMELNGAVLDQVDAEGGLAFAEHVLTNAARLLDGSRGQPKAAASAGYVP